MSDALKCWQAVIRDLTDKSDTPRTEYTPEAWTMAEWAIPLHVHPLGAGTWDVVNCHGDWKPPTPDQVRSYIAQAIFKFQKETVRPLERENEALRKDAERYRWLREFGARARIYFPANRGTEMEIATAEKLDSAIDAAIKEQSNG